MCRWDSQGVGTEISRWVIIREGPCNVIQVFDKWEYFSDRKLSSLLFGILDTALSLVGAHQLWSNLLDILLLFYYYYFFLFLVVQTHWHALPVDEGHGVRSTKSKNFPQGLHQSYSNIFCPCTHSDSGSPYGVGDRVILPTSQLPCSDGGRSTRCLTPASLRLYAWES